MIVHNIHQVGDLAIVTAFGHGINFMVTFNMKTMELNKGIQMITDKGLLTLEDLKRRPHYNSDDFILRLETIWNGIYMHSKESNFLGEYMDRSRARV